MCDLAPERRDGCTNGCGRYTRRTILGSGVATLGLGIGGVVTGQETGTPDTPITTRAAIRDPEDIDQELGGFWIHLAAELEPYEASVADQCDAIPWSDLEAQAFDGMLVDRAADPDQLQVTVYLHDAVDVDGGDLFIVNEVHSCEGPYVALDLEQIGADDVQVGPRATDLGEGEETTDDTGPGLGVLAAIAGFLGASWLARRIGDEGE